jgi:hypothetical protein
MNNLVPLGAVVMTERTTCNLACTHRGSRNPAAVQAVLYMYRNS